MAWAWRGLQCTCMLRRGLMWPDLRQAHYKAFCNSMINQWARALVHHCDSPGGLHVQAIIDNFRDVEMGGRVYVCMVGSAPSAPEVMHFLRTALVAPILESFGSTETGDNSCAGMA